MPEKLRSNCLEGCRFTKHRVGLVFVNRANWLELDTLGIYSEYDDDDDDDDCGDT
jgi:hypothetical protein